MLGITTLILSLAAVTTTPTTPTSVRELYTAEYLTIIEAAEANDCADPVLLCVLFAIRTAENGRAGIEFGVLNPRAKDQPNSLRVQAGWCAATVAKNHKRWIESEQEVDFITFLGRRYCPVGADNDPGRLNKHWIGNVRRITERNMRLHFQHDPGAEYYWRTAKELSDAEGKR
jgi:hypothetical protein